METNTKLDYGIAMEVMGWHLDDAGFWRDVAGKPKMSSGDVENYPDLLYTDWPTWSPTSNWAHFGLVLERIYTEYADFTLEVCRGAARFGTFYWMHPQAEDSGSTVLENACAAILHVWSEVKDDGR
jgi:hypothetical protein